MNKSIVIVFFALLLVGVGCKSEIVPTEQSPLTINQTDMKISSSSFDHEGSIPSKYTCDGENINPPLEIREVPEGAQSLVLLMDDPDVPRSIRPDGMWDHWTVFNIPALTAIIEENSVPAGVVGLNSSGANKYGGPCPPDREHRYFFKLYALDTMLGLAADSSKTDVEKAMEGHILAEAVLLGRYERQ